MSNICNITNKNNIKGNKISKSNKQFKRIFNINLLKKRIFILNKWIKIKISAAGLRLINKLGFKYEK